MPPAEALPLMEQMAAGLNFAHQAGVVQRDFKSANLMLLGERMKRRSHTGGGPGKALSD